MENEQKPLAASERTPEEIRLEAENRQLTVPPLHQDVIPDEEPDAVQAARHVNGPSLANAPNDTEQNAHPVTPAKGFLELSKPRPPLPRTIRSAVVASLVFLIAIVAVIIVYILV